MLSSVARQRQTKMFVFAKLFVREKDLTLILPTLSIFSIPQPLAAITFISFRFVQIRSFRSDSFNFEGVSLNELNETYGWLITMGVPLEFGTAERRL